LPDILWIFASGRSEDPAISGVAGSREERWQNAE
jgi:hypothetical protein